MNMPTFDQKTTLSNQDNHKWTLPSEEELRLQIKQLKGNFYNDRITLKRLVIGAAYLLPFSFLTIFTFWLAWY